MDELPGFSALRSFLALAEDLHFARAAARLGVSQPSLSQQIKGLEALLGAELFRRTRRSVELTPAGHALVQEARQLLAQGQRLRTNVSRVARGETGELRIGFVASGAYDLLPAIIRRFRASRPGAQVALDECALNVPVDSLMSGTLDLAIVRGPFRHPPLETETLFREPLCAVVPDSHALAHRKVIALDALADEAFVLFPRRRAPAFHDAITECCRAAGFAPRIVEEAADWQLLASMVAAGLAVTLAPESVRQLPRSGVRYVSLTPRRLVAQLDLVYAPTRLSALTDEFRRAAHETVRPRVK